MIFLKEMLREGWIKAEADSTRFKSQLDRIPAEKLPEDKRFNPLASNPYILYKALPHVRRYSSEELVEAMRRLLECNQRLIFSNLDEALVLQQTLVQIVCGGNGEKPALIELLNPNPRVADLLENLGVAHLFRVVCGPELNDSGLKALGPTPGSTDRKEMSRHCLDAHRTLMEINPENVGRFKDV